jgi:hypothetical protein
VRSNSVHTLNSVTDVELPVKGLVVTAIVWHESEDNMCHLIHVIWTVVTDNDSHESSILKEYTVMTQKSCLSLRVGFRTRLCRMSTTQKIYLCLLSVTKSCMCVNYKVLTWIKKSPILGIKRIVSHLTFRRNMSHLFWLLSWLHPSVVKLAAKYFCDMAVESLCVPEDVTFFTALARIVYMIPLIVSYV